jgi:hypothetical protein
MSKYGPTEIKRRTNGSIDIDFYAAKGLSERCEAGNCTLRTVPRLIGTTARSVALWLARAVRPRASTKRKVIGASLGPTPAPRRGA